MIEYISGELVSISPCRVVVDVCGVGYVLFVLSSLFANLHDKCGSRIVLYVASIIKENDKRCFGFVSAAERDFFNKLCSVHGVGPKVALSILNIFTFDQLVLVVDSADVNALCKVPGVGKRLAERLCVELKIIVGESIANLPGSSPVIQDGCAALVSLGYSPIRAKAVIDMAYKDLGRDSTVDELLRHALSKTNVAKT